MIAEESSSDLTSQSDADEAIKGVKVSHNILSLKLILHYLEKFLNWLMNQLIVPDRYNRKEFFLGWKIMALSFKHNYTLTKFFIIFELARVMMISIIVTFLYENPYL